MRRARRPEPFFVPILIGGGAVITAIWGGQKTISSISRNSAAKRRYERKREKYEIRCKRFQGKTRKAERLLEDLGRTRLNATKTLARAAEFIRNAQVKDRRFLDRVGVPQETLQEWDRRTIDAVEIATGVGKGALAGTATAFGVYGLAGAIGTASTGTAISTLSGVAATNATYAFLGGGSLAAGGGGMFLGTLVLGGAVAGPAILVAGFFLESRVDVVEREVERVCGEYDVAIQEVDNRSARLKVVSKRTDEIGQNIKRAVQHVETLIRERSSSVDKDVYDVYVAATSLAALIDTPVIQPN